MADEIEWWERLSPEQFDRFFPNGQASVDDLLRRRREYAEAGCPPTCTDMEIYMMIAEMAREPEPAAA